METTRGGSAIAARKPGGAAWPAEAILKAMSRFTCGQSPREEEWRNAVPREF